MIDANNLIGKYAITLVPLGGPGGKIFVWTAVKICHYRDSKSFSPTYKVCLKPVGIFEEHVQEDSFYTNDLNFLDAKELNTQFKQPEKWSSVYVYGFDKEDLTVATAKALNNVRGKMGLFSEALPEDIKDELGLLGCLKFLYRN